MKTITIVCLLLLTIFLLASCAEDAIMFFYNDTDSMTEIRVDNVNHELPAYQTLERKWELTSQAFSVSELPVSIRIKEKLFLFSQQYTVVLRAGSRVYKSIEPDAGSLKICNESSSPITEVYITPRTSSHWGSNRLAGAILPNVCISWNLTEGYWNLKVVSQWGDQYIAYDQRFFIGHLNTYYIYDWKTQGSSEEIKNEQLPNVESIDTRIEQIF